MNKNILKVILMVVLIMLGSMVLFSNSYMKAESISRDSKKIKLISNDSLRGNIEYHETKDTFFWKLTVTKYESIVDTQLSVDISYQGEDMESPKMILYSGGLSKLEGTTFEEVSQSKENQVYIFEFSTTKVNNKAVGKLIINFNLNEFDDKGVSTTILDRLTSGHFETIPESSQKDLLESDLPKENIDGTEQDTEVVSGDVEQSTEVIPIITQEADDKAIYPTIRGKSFLEEIAPIFLNTSLLDPFAYLQDILGKYPTHNSGILQGNEVRNYNYSIVDSSPLISGRNRPTVVKPPVMTGKTLDFTTGYHEYSGAYLKKWVEPVKDQAGTISDPTLFNVFLEVIGDSNQQTTPIDIILVLDKSGSMTEQIGSQTKDTQLRTAVKNFSNSLLTVGLDVKIGLVNYGSASSDDDGGLPVSQTEFLTNSATTINNSSVLNRTPLGYTPTDLGLSNGLTALYGTGSRANASKIMVFLSDGAPTKYYKPVEVRSRLVGPPKGPYTSWSNYLATNNGTTPGSSAGPLYNYDGSLIVSNEKFPNKFGPIVFGDPNLPLLSANGLTEYEYRWAGYQWLGNGMSDSAREGMTYTLGYANWLFAQDPKYANVSLYSIGLGIGGTEEIATIGRNTLKNLAKNPNNYYSADTQGQLVTIFSSIASNITKTIQSAHVFDPLGDAVNLIGEPKVESFSVSSLGKTTWAGITGNDPKQFVTLTKSAGNRGLEWKSVTLGKNEGLRFSYQVQLAEPYQSGLFQQANGETYLENGTTVNGTPYDSTNRLHFAIPSVRYKSTTSITVQKIWSDSTNYWGLRTPVTLQLQRMVPGGAYQNVSGATYTIQPSATGTQLQNTFTGLDKFDSTGQRYTYQVIENAGPTGYATPTYSNQNLTVTNALITTNLTFKKLDNDGLTALPNIVFELRAANGRKIQATSNSSGVVTFTGIPIGTHSIAEVTDLNGYQALPSFKATVSKVSDTLLSTTYNMAGVPAEMYTLSGQNLTVINKYEKGKFSFKKVGNDGVTPLSQVTFDLIQGGSVVQEVTSTTNGTVLFNNIYPGDYTLKEVSSANGYSLISDIPLVVTKNKNASGEFIVQGLPEGNIVQNKLKNFSLSLNKVAVDNIQKEIVGAEFSLYYLGNFVEKQVSDVNGKVDFNQNLIPGRNYTVKETAVPEGYLPITGVFTIQVKTSGQVIVDYAGTVLTNSQMSVGLTSGSGNNTIQYTVTNDPKRPLPRTGGMGIYVPITTGAIAMLVAYSIYIYRKCRKGGVRQ